MRRFRTSLPLAVHISTLFGLLVIATAAAIGWISYQRTTELIQGNGREIAQGAARQIRLEFEAIFRPVEVGVSLIAHHRTNLANTLPIRLDGLTFFREALSGDAPVASFYIGYDDGDFFLVRAIVSDRDRRLFKVGPEVRYLVQSIDRDFGTEDGRFLYLDHAGQIVDEVEKPNYPKDYDPRVRTWYRSAMASPGLVRTDPYVFRTTGTIGITFARKSEIANTVVAADIDLEFLCAIVRRYTPTPHTKMAIVDAAGHVIAFDDPTVLVHHDDSSHGAGSVAVAKIDSFPIEELRRVHDHAAAAPHADDQFVFDTNGTTWRGLSLPINVRGDAPLTLLIAVPEDEILAAALQIQREMVIVTIVVFLATIGLTLLMSVSISRSLVNLSIGAQRILRFDFSGNFRRSSIVSEVHTLSQGFETLRLTLGSFIRSVTMISEEKDFSSLLMTLLTELSSVLGVRRAILYVVPQQIDGLVVAAIKDGDRVTLADEQTPQPMPALVTAAINGGQRGWLSGRVGPDELELPGLNDISHPTGGYERSLCYPLRDRNDHLIGTMLFLDSDNASEGAAELVRALTGTAAVSLETRQLIVAQRRLFDAFIQIIAGAIDAKSPYTGGHCTRVPVLTRMLAQAAHQCEDGPYRNFRLSDQDWEAIHLATWLHDCGKVTTPEYVVDKATKLETIHDRIHEVRMRFEVLKRDAEIAFWQGLAEGGDRTVLQAALDQALATLDQDFAFVAACNEGGEFMGADKVERLRIIAERTWRRTLSDRIGISQEEKTRKEVTPEPVLPVDEPLLADKPEHILVRRAADDLTLDDSWGIRMVQPAHLYNRGELHNLSVSRGTLTEEERYKINEHIVQSIMMLSRLPFPRHLRQVPELACAHHEKMDGTGYPRGLTKDQMSPVARMVAIADIFEALTAGDRPYKKGKTLSEALKIMSFMVKDQHIDAELFNLFLTSGVWRTYAEQYMAPHQIDAIDIDRYRRAA